MKKTIGLAVVGLMLAGTGSAAQQDDTDPWNHQGTNVTPKTVSSVYVPAPSQGSVAAPAYSGYQITPQQREELKRTMAQTAKQVSQVTKDFKEFYGDLQKAVQDSGIVDEVNKMNLGDAAGAAAGSGGFGAADIRVQDDTMTLTMDLPGVSKKNLSVALAETSAVRIRVDRNAPNNPSEYRLMERYRGNFDKTVQLPFKPSGKKFTANLKDGVLTVRIPRDRTADAKEIPIEIQ